MINTIIFDMGGVLMDFNPRMFVERYNLPEEDGKALIDAIFNCGEWAMLDFGYMTEEKLAEIAKGRLPHRLHSYVDPLIREWDKPVVPIPGTAELVRRLKERGYKLYLLSNAGPRHDEYWPNVPGSEYFDGKLVSCYVKTAKPLYDIYKLLLDKFSLKAEECLFVDDNIMNVAASKICGIEAIPFRGSADLEEHLKSLGIL